MPTETYEQRAFEAQGYLIVGCKSEVPIGGVLTEMQRHLDSPAFEQRQLVVGTASYEEFVEQGRRFNAVDNWRVDPRWEALHRTHFFYKVIAE